MIDEYTELNLASDSLLSYESANNSVRFCFNTLRLVEDAIVIRRKVEVAKFNNGSDSEFPTEFRIARYVSSLYRIYNH